MAVLLNEVETAVLRGDDEREVVALHDRVGSPGPVGSLDLVPAQPCPVIGIDDAGRKCPNLWLSPSLSGLSMHRTILPRCSDQGVKRELPKMVVVGAQFVVPKRPLRSAWPTSRP